MSDKSLSTKVVAMPAPHYFASVSTKGDSEEPQSPVAQRLEASSPRPESPLTEDQRFIPLKKRKFLMLEETKESLGSSTQPPLSPLTQTISSHQNRILTGESIPTQSPIRGGGRGSPGARTATVSPATSEKEAVTFCTCPVPPKEEDEDVFWIQCDFCQAWYHGDCFEMDEVFADKVELWACTKCTYSGKNTSYKVPCANKECRLWAINLVNENGKLQKLDINTSRYCSKTCGSLAARHKVIDVLKTVPKKVKVYVKPVEFNRVEHNPDFKSDKPDPFDYSDFTEPPSALTSELEEIRKRIRDVEHRLTLIDSIIEKTHKHNASLGLTGAQAICGFDFRIIRDWTHPGISNHLPIIPETSAQNDPTTDQPPPVESLYDSQCTVTGKCQKHWGWQKIRVQEAEIEIESLTDEYREVYERMKLSFCK